MAGRPNIVFILADQLRAASLPLYGERQIETPHIARLAAGGVTLTNAVSTCPVCTPYRSMLLTGRRPQQTGHLINFVQTRHDEISIGDAFGRSGYRTGWIGKWHLHTGSFPQVPGPDYVPEGRDRLGFEWWRGYNFHCKYFDGWVNADDWRNERWEGYETDALNRYAFEFIDAAGEEPFCVFLSPHQPHATGESAFAPDHCYDRLPKHLELPPNVPTPDEGTPLPPREMYRHYLAMTVALDDMVGQMLDYLDDRGLSASTLVVFTSDHGTQAGAQGIQPWAKKMPYEESLLVPFVMRLPGILDGGVRRDALTSPVDIFPSLCNLCGVPAPRTVAGRDLSAAWRGADGAVGRDAVLCMNFGGSYDYLVDGTEWRAVRTVDHIFTRWLDGREELFDLRADPLQMDNLVDRERDMRDRLDARLTELMAEIDDELVPCTAYRGWFDAQRRVIRNAAGPLPDPEGGPDWSLLI